MTRCLLRMNILKPQGLLNATLSKHPSGVTWTKQRRDADCWWWKGWSMAGSFQPLWTLGPMGTLWQAHQQRTAVLTRIGPAETIRFGNGSRQRCNKRATIQLKIGEYTDNVEVMIAELGS